MNYPHILFAVCLAGSESIGNAMALAVGFKGLGQAFGGEFGLGLRAIGSSDTTPSAWAHQSVARDSAAALVEEYNAAGPYPLLGEKGIAAEQVAAAKPAVIAERFSRETHEYAFVTWLASKGYEIIPRA